jgi:hypothetical protein
MATASRVRVTLEFRNGDDHFIKVVTPTSFEPIKSEGDIDALERAFLHTIVEHLGRVEAVRKMIAQHDKRPGHD